MAGGKHTFLEENYAALYLLFCTSKGDELALKSQHQYECIKYVASAQRNFAGLYFRLSFAKLKKILRKYSLGPVGAMRGECVVSVACAYTVHGADMLMENVKIFRMPSH